MSFPWFILGFVPLTHQPDLLRLQEDCPEAYSPPRDGFFERHFESHAGHSEHVRGARAWCWLFGVAGTRGEDWWVKMQFKKHIPANTLGRASKIPRNMCFYCFDLDSRRRRRCSITKQISHAPVRLLLRKDIKTIQRHLPHACKNNINSLRILSLEFLRKEAHASFRPAETIHKHKSTFETRRSFQ